MLESWPSLKQWWRQQGADPVGAPGAGRGGLGWASVGKRGGAGRREKSREGAGGGAPKGSPRQAGCG